MDSYMTCDHIKELKSPQEVNVNVQGVDVLPLPDHLRQTEIHGKCQSSTSTMAEYVTTLHNAGHSEVFLVLGFSCTGQRDEHVILRVGQHHYDPLLIPSDRYVRFSKVCEMSAQQLLEFMLDHNGKLPALSNCCARLSCR